MSRREDISYDEVIFSGVTYRQQSLDPEIAPDPGKPYFDAKAELDKLLADQFEQLLFWRGLIRKYRGDAEIYPGVKKGFNDILKDGEELICYRNHFLNTGKREREFASLIETAALQIAPRV